MKKHLQNSIDKKHVIKMSTKHPDGDSYNAVILSMSNTIVTFQDTSEFSFEGVSIIPRKWLVDIRDGEFEECYDKILRQNGEMKNLNRKKWINEISSVKEAISMLHQKGIWPAIEVFDGQKETAMFLGPITNVKATKFSVWAYDAAGNWEQEYDIKYSEVFCIQLFNQYTERFNHYMKGITKPE